MRKIIASRFSIQVAVIVNFAILTAAVFVIAAFLKQENRRHEKQLLANIKYKSMIGAEMIGAILNESIDNGVFSVQDVFDTEYQQIGEFDPPKYHTRYDTYLDKAVLKLQNEFLKDKNILYAAGVDKNGYVPTHNSRYQQAFTGDPERDKVGNRTKRLFDDSVGLTAAQNTEPGLLQVYRRDTGETLWDISSPIYVKNQHWGAFRIGVSLASIAKSYRDLSVSIFWIVLPVFLISTVLTYCVVYYLLAPLRRITEKLQELTIGQNIKNEIAADSKGDFGELQKAVELLRLSLLKALQRAKRAREQEMSQNIQINHLKNKKVGESSKIKSASPESVP